MVEVVAQELTVLLLLTATTHSTHASIDMVRWSLSSTSSSFAVVDAVRYKVKTRRLPCSRHTAITRMLEQGSRIATTTQQRHNTARRHNTDTATTRLGKSTQQRHNPSTRAPLPPPLPTTRRVPRHTLLLLLTCFPRPRHTTLPQGREGTPPLLRLHTLMASNSSGRENNTHAVHPPPTPRSHTPMQAMASFVKDPTSSTCSAMRRTLPCGNVRVNGNAVRGQQFAERTPPFIVHAFQGHTYQRNTG